jgi:hypothetical protein
MFDIWSYPTYGEREMRSYVLLTRFVSLFSVALLLTFSGRSAEGSACIKNVTLQARENTEGVTGRCPNEIAVLVFMEYEDFDGANTLFEGRLFVDGRERRFTPNILPQEPTGSGTKLISLGLACEKASSQSPHCLLSLTGTATAKIKVTIFGIPCGETTPATVESNTVFRARCFEDP